MAGLVDGVSDVEAEANVQPRHSLISQVGRISLASYLKGQND